MPRRKRHSARDIVHTLHHAYDPQSCRPRPGLLQLAVVRYPVNNNETVPERTSHPIGDVSISMPFRDHPSPVPQPARAGAALGQAMEAKLVANTETCSYVQGKLDYSRYGFVAVGGGHLSSCDASRKDCGT